MKLRSLALALTSALLLPALAHASDDTAAIRASFDRVTDRGLALAAEAAGSHPLPAIDGRQERDQILASFERILSIEMASRQIHAESQAKDEVPG